MPFSRDHLIAARRAAGLSQPQLADLAAINVQTLRAMEQGRTPNPTGDTVEAVALALGVPMNALYSGSAEVAVA